MGMRLMTPSHSQGSRRPGEFLHNNHPVVETRIERAYGHALVETVSKHIRFVHKICRYGEGRNIRCSEMHAICTARFHISADGQVRVSGVYGFCKRCRNIGAKLADRAFDRIAECFKCESLIIDALLERSFDRLYRRARKKTAIDRGGGALRRSKPRK